MFITFPRQYAPMWQYLSLIFSMHKCVPLICELQGYDEYQSTQCTLRYQDLEKPIQVQEHRILHNDDFHEFLSVS